MHYLGIAGRARSGKTTLANLVKSRLEARGATVVILPFAAPVKDIAYRMGWDGEKDEKGRRLLQLIGTECGRECSGDYVWVSAWSRALSAKTEYWREDTVVIADDVRFPNEVDIIRKRGGIVVALTRGHDPWWRRLTRHRSERVPPGLRQFDNSGDLSALGTLADDLAHSLH